MIRRFLLFSLLAAALCFATVRSPIARAAELTIGSPAPALDIEHWVQDGNGFFDPVTEFEDGKIYVVEFWATWCGPCIQSMPQLAEMQQKFRGEGVQIISITTETLDEVKDLLGKEHPAGGKTFAEITSAYCLTADPDESASDDYMRASGSNGIPMAFIVGKTGEIDWMGHPMSMDDPLQAIIDDQWDRDAFKKEMEEQKLMQENMQQLARLAGTGKLDEALQFVEELIASASSDIYRSHWTSIKNELKLSGDRLDDETIAYFRAQLVTLEEEKQVQSLLQLGNFLYGVTEQGAKAGPLVKDTIAAIERQELADVPEVLVPLYHNTLARLSELEGNFKKAAAAQAKAMESSDPRQQRRMMPYLEELREKAGIAKIEEKEKD